MLKGMVAEDQAKVTAAHAELSVVLEKHGDAGVVALALLAAETFNEMERGTKP